MKSVSRGLLAVVGIVGGFFTLVFLTQTARYLPPALAGHDISIGMSGFYLILSYFGTTVTVLSFIPKTMTAKYLSGGGVGLAGILLLSTVYLFTVDIASGLMLLVITAIQSAIAAGVFLAAHSLGDGGEFDPEQASGSVEAQPERSSNESIDEPSSSAQNMPGQSTEEIDPDPKSSRDINWWEGAQIFSGGTIFLVGIPITVQSPVGVPILLVGLALIPRIRSWALDKLGKPETDNND